MGRLRTMLGIAAAVCAAMTLLAGAALAGNPNNPGTGGPPAGQGTPPGQAKKGTTGQGNAANGKALGKGKEKAGKASQPAHPTHPSHPSHPSHPVTPSHPDGTATKVIVPQKPAFAATKGKGHENTAHHKVIICHRTGSATNPYVAINVSINAWQNGHTKHPALDGRSDILLKDPASPGEKPDPALVASMCGGQPAQSAQQAAAQAATANAAKSSPRIVAAAGVKGAAASKPSASQPKGSAGVLGAISTPVRRGELPFTGLPLWTAALAAGTLGALGLALRRRAQAS